MVSNSTFCGEVYNSFQVEYEFVLSFVYVFIWIARLFGNFLNIVVFSQKQMISPFNKIFLWLSISDLFKLVSIALFVLSCGWCQYMDYTFMFFRPHSSFSGAKALQVSVFLLQAFHTIIVGLNITLAFWRYLTLAHPLQTEFKCDYRSARLTVMGSYVLSFILSLPVLFAFSVHEGKGE